MTKYTALAIAILASCPAAVAAEWPPPPPGMTYNINLKPHSLVVTNVDLDGKRDKTDLNVYAPQNDFGAAHLPSECFPVTSNGRDYSADEVSIRYETWADGLQMWWIYIEGKIVGNFTSSDAVYETSQNITAFGGRPPEPWNWPKLVIPQKPQPTGDTLATTSTVANIARSVVNTVWDAELGVAWEARMHNGALYYVAVTNKPPEVK